MASRRWSADAAALWNGLLALLGAFALTQLGVVAIVRGRVARLRALAHVAHDEALRRYR